MIVRSYASRSFANPCPTVVVKQDVHLDSPLTEPDFASPRPIPHLGYSAIAATTLLVEYGGILRSSGRSANLPLLPITTPIPTIPEQPPSPLLRPSSRSGTLRHGKGRARKEDKPGDLVRPEHIEAALIEVSILHIHQPSVRFLIPSSLILIYIRSSPYHCTSSEDLHPSYTRNFGRNTRYLSLSSRIQASTAPLGRSLAVYRYCAVHGGIPKVRASPLRVSTRLLRSYLHPHSPTCCEGMPL